jgi:hypothetical protein
LTFNAAPLPAPRGQTACDNCTRGGSTALTPRRPNRVAQPFLLFAPAGRTSGDLSSISWGARWTPPHVRKCHQMSSKEHMQLGWVILWVLRTAPPRATPRLGGAALRPLPLCTFAICLGLGGVAPPLAVPRAARGTCRGGRRACWSPFCFAAGQGPRDFKNPPPDFQARWPGTQFLYLNGAHDAQEEAVETRSNLRALAEYAEKAAQDGSRKWAVESTQSGGNGGATRPAIYDRTAEQGKR